MTSTIRGADNFDTAQTGINIQTSVAASGANIDFTGIPTWVKRVNLAFVNLSTNGSSNLQVQLGTSGGLTTSGYSGTSAFAGSGSLGVLFTTGFGVVSSVAPNTVVSGMLVLHRVAGNTWLATVAGGYSSTAAAITGGGTVTLPGQLDRLRLTTVNGTDLYDAGTLALSWE